MQINRTKSMEEELRRLYANVRNRQSELKSTDRGYRDFETWCTKNQIGRGFSDGNIRRVRKSILDYIQNGLPKRFNIEADPYVQKANRFLEVSEDYLNKTSRDELSGKSWFMFYLHIGEEKARPRIARVVLKTSNDNKVELKNLPKNFDQYSEDLSGHYERLKAGIVFFDLFRKERHDSEQKSRVLHLKACYLSEEDELMIGTYNTYDEHRVYSGAMVLLRIEEGEKNLERFSVSHKDNPELFKEIPWQIRKYLSIKRRNFYLLPTPKPSLDALLHHVTEFSILGKRKDRFLELEKPRIFIATPIGGRTKDNEELTVQENKIERLCSTLQEELKEIADVESRFGRVSTTEEELGDLESLKLLKRTSFFILVLDDVDRASYSMMEFGYALSQVKYLMIVYKRGVISNRLKHSLDSLSVRRKPFESLDKEGVMEEILDSIKSYVRRSLKNDDYWHIS